MTGPLPWEGMTHAEIHALVHAGPGPGASTHAEDLWRRVAEIVAAGEAAMDRAVRDSEGMWEGSTGDSARSGLHQLNSWARDAATDAANTTAAMGNQGVHAGHLRATVPQPYTDEYAVAERFANENPFDEGIQRAFLDAQDEKALRDEQAREKMATYHYDSVRNRALMDVWTTPPTVVVEAATTAPAIDGAAGAGGAPSGGAAGPGGALMSAPAGGVDGSALTTGAAGAAVGGGGVGLPTGAVGADSAAAAAPPATAAPVGPTGAASAGSGVAGAASVGSRGGGSAGGGSIPGPGGASTGSGGGTSTGPGTTGRAGGTAGALPGAVGGSTGRVTTPPTGRDSLPPGAGGRGPRLTPPPSGLTPGSGGAQALVPRPPIAPAPPSTWRDLVAANRAPEPAPRLAGETAVRPGQDLARPGAGAGNAIGPGSATTTPTARPDGLRAAGPGGAGYAGHGLYPPATAGASGATGETHRRPDYLVDDTGVFDVEDQLHHTEPVIRGTDQERRPG